MHAKKMWSNLNCKNASNFVINNNFFIKKKPKSSNIKDFVENWSDKIVVFLSFWSAISTFDDINIGHFKMEDMSVCSLSPLQSESSSYCRKLSTASYPSSGWGIWSWPVARICRWVSSAPCRCCAAGDGVRAVAEEQSG